MRILGLLGILWLAVVSAAQKPVPRNPEGLLDIKKPSVYLSFERLGPRPPKFKTESKTGVWLRLHNNTARLIALYGTAELRNVTRGELPDGALGSFAVDGAEFDLCYEADAFPIFISRIRKTEAGNALEMEVPYKAKIPEQSHFDSCYWTSGRDRRGRPVWLKPGHSVLFSVPKNFLSKNRRIATEISYEWESEDGYIFEYEPRHLVYFNYHQLEEAEYRLSRKPAGP